jgi:putative phosphonate metabolism protein
LLAVCLNERSTAATVDVKGACHSTVTSLVSIEYLKPMFGPRFAIYFVPPARSLLAEFGAGMLGYDAETAASVARTHLIGVERREAIEMTHEPARYGFHATLKAPFALAPGRSEDGLKAAMNDFATEHAPAKLGRVVLRELGAFLVLEPEEAAEQVTALAVACVEEFESFRAPLTEQEFARRRAAGLSARQEKLLAHWGYPYVLEEFRFHMTLAGPLPEERREVWRRALASAFHRLAERAWTIDSISLARQAEPAARFQIVHRAPLTGHV